MNYFFLNYRNDWQQVQNLENLQNAKEVKLYDYCEKTNCILFIGIGLY